MNRFLILIVSVFYFTSIVSAQYQLENAYPNLTFEQPVDFQHSGDGTNRVFVLEQKGIIHVFENSPTVASSKIFLDISSKVVSGGERGLLGLAFHPDYETNGYFYVNYTRNSNPDQLQSVVARYNVSADADSADPESELIILTLDQPQGNHNGGQTSFGPDGYLYIAFGDGGGAGDTQNNAQRLQNLLGKILRIDINNTTGELNYAIPPDNPFVGQENSREEIYAYGLRNPWRFSFDRFGKIWCGDVGQGAWEEIDTIQKGHNYGWRIMEGTHCYNPSTNCDTAGLTLPIYEYGHNQSGGFSITGGFVYEGEAVPEIKGRYIFADYVSRRVWSLGYYGINPELPIVELLLTAPDGISSFGIDESNELYLCSFDGKIYKFKSIVNDANEKEINLNNYALLQNYPNPFNPSTKIRYNLPEESKVMIEIVDITGKYIGNLIDTVKPAGFYEYEWNAGKSESLSSGIYYIRIRAEGLSSFNSFEKVIKAVYLK